MRATRLLLTMSLAMACGRAPPPPEKSIQPNPAQDPGFLNSVTGVTVVPETGERLWLKTGVGVVDSSGKTVLADATGYDDLVALDANRVALIMQNDGFVFELGTRLLLNRFCYLPESSPPGDWQRSNVVGWDPAEKHLFVQARTFNSSGPRGPAQLGVFEPYETQPLEWQELSEPQMQAGGIAVQSKSRIWLAWGTRLFRYNAQTRAIEKTFELGGNEVTSLALEGDHLLVLSARGEGSASAHLATLKLSDLQ